MRALLRRRRRPSCSMRRANRGLRPRACKGRTACGGPCVSTADSVRCGHPVLPRCARSQMPLTGHADGGRAYGCAITSRSRSANRRCSQPSSRITCRQWRTVSAFAGVVRVAEFLVEHLVGDAGQVVAHHRGPVRACGQDRRQRTGPPRPCCRTRDRGDGSQPHHAPARLCPARCRCRAPGGAVSPRMTTLHSSLPRTGATWHCPASALAEDR